MPVEYVIHADLIVKQKLLLLVVNIKSVFIVFAKFSMARRSLLITILLQRARRNMKHQSVYVEAKFAVGAI